MVEIDLASAVDLILLIAGDERHMLDGMRGDSQKRMGGIRTWEARRWIGGTVSKIRQ